MNLISPKGLKYLIALSVLLIPVMSFADSKTIEAAQVAVRRAIRSDLGTGFRVAFEKPIESLLSLSEVVVSGEAHASQGNSWRFEKSFTYTVKVKMDGSQTRDVKIKYKDGSNFDDQPGWSQSHHQDDYVSISKPEWYQRLDSNDVVFEGEATGEVLITVLDPRDQVVTERRAYARNGRFRTSLNLPNGIFRAVVKPAGSFDSDEVRFTVRSNSNDWGHGFPPNRPGQGGSPDDIIQIREPGNDATVRGPQVTFSGTASERSIRIQIWDSRDNRVFDNDVSVRSRTWETSVRLQDGRYRVKVEGPSGRDTDIRNFRVQTDFLQFEQPVNNSTVQGPRVTVSGRCSESMVRVQIWDSRNNRVENRSVPTRDGYWNTSVQLDDDRYRIMVDTPSGRVRGEARSFEVRSKSKPGGGSNSGYLQFEQPVNNSTVQGPRVTISGRSSESSVRVQIWDSRNNRVENRNVPTRDGYWNTSIQLDDDRYRVMVDTSNDRIRSEARSFEVRSKNKPGGGGNVTFRVTSPRKDSTVSGPRVTLSGDCGERSVKVQIFDSRKNKLFDQTVPTLNGSWTTSASLDGGRQYRVRVTSDSGRDDAEFWFTVR